MNEVTKVGLLLCVGLVLNVVLADWYRERVMWNGIPETTTRQFDEARGGIDTLILGDSHAKRGLYPSVLGDAFNLSIPGQKYTQTYYVVRSQIEDGSVDLRIVILPADLHTFALWNTDNFAFVRYYAPIANYLEIGWHRGALWLYAVRGLQGRYAPYVGGRQNILSYLATGRPAVLQWLQDTPMVEGALVDARTIAKLPPDEIVERARQRARLHLGDAGPIAPIHEWYFSRTLELCAANDIEVVLVQYPVTRAYLDAVSERTDIEAFDRRIQALIEPYRNVRLVPSRNLYGKRLDLFIDPDHLNERGATSFSRRIKRRVLDPLRQRIARD